jgi:hypothetical protein
MNDPEMNLYKEDVSISEIEDPTCDHEGENCVGTVSHRVMIDFRMVGQRTAILGDFCEPCATEIMKAIQKSLPPYPNPIP